jgi:carbamoyltransferase
MTAKSTKILGISAFYHDSAAALVIDGKIVAAAQEERFTRKKADAGFPINAIRYCLEEGGITAEEIDYVGFYEKPLRKFERLLETYLAYAPFQGLPSFLKAMPVWLRQKLFLRHELDKGLGGTYRGRYIYCDHHESHAASAFFPSPFDEAAILTIDGVGEWSTTTYGVGRGNKVELTHEIRFPHSLGLLYSAMTYYTGFKVNSGEYKVMGLAPYGEPKFKDALLKEVMDLKPDGSFRLDMSYFNYCQGLTMTSEKLHRLLGGPPRKPESFLTQREMDLAASIQAVCEEVVFRAARHLHAETKQKNLVLAGGVALNCVANGKLLRDGPFEKIWIQPAAGDAGGALGVALLTWYQLLGKPRTAEPEDSMEGALLGPRYEAPEIKRYLDDMGAKYTFYGQDEPGLLERVTEEIAAGKIVGWFGGRMEYGPRALGSRSIIGDPRNPEMQAKMNLKIKFRESFRPFAPAVLRDRVHEPFLMREREPSPYMLLVAPVREEIRAKLTDEQQRQQRDPDLRKRVNVVRSTIPAVTHVDYSARVQTVDERNGRYFKLIKRFEEKTGCPVIVNTSFNIRGEPIVESPEDAFRCFMATEMDVLVLEDTVLSKTDQPEKLTAAYANSDAYKNKYELD